VVQEPPPITGEAELGKSLLASSVQEVVSSILSDASIGASITDESGRRLTANGAFCNLLAYSLKELKQLDLPAVTHPDDPIRLRTDHRPYG
jgi:PAS domain-containing protein